MYPFISAISGTGGFLLSTAEYLAKHYELDKDQKEHLRYDAVRGIELVDSVARLCAMNIYSHGIGPSEDEREPPIAGGEDSLRNEPSEYYEVVVSNPPFGKKSSITVVNEEGETDKQSLTYNRPDFWTTTTNKQLNFLQHINAMLKMNGRAAVVVPDNVLFEGGAGETVRRKLMQNCNLHTVLRLPTEIFYPQGVKANVHFFERRPARETPWTSEIWSNKHFTLKAKRMPRSDLDEFLEVYKADARHGREPTWSEENPEGRCRSYSYDFIIGRDKASLEDSANLPDLHILAAEIADDLESVLNQIRDVFGDLEERAGVEQ